MYSLRRLAVTEGRWGTSTSLAASTRRAPTAAGSKMMEVFIVGVSNPPPTNPHSAASRSVDLRRQLIVSRLLKIVKNQRLRAVHWYDADSYWRWVALGPSKMSIKSGKPCAWTVAASGVCQVRESQHKRRASTAAYAFCVLMGLCRLTSCSICCAADVELKSCRPKYCKHPSNRKINAADKTRTRCVLFGFHRNVAPRALHVLRKLIFIHQRVASFFRWYDSTFGM